MPGKIGIMYIYAVSPGREQHEMTSPVNVQHIIASEAF